MEGFKKYEKYFFVLGLVSIILLSIAITAHPNISFDQDLGRHLILGEIIWETGSVPHTNLFSYTHQNFPFINHHWLSEVIFYGFSNLLGVMSLTILKIILITGALLLIFYSAFKKAGLIPSLFSALLLTPLLMERAHVRPEIFGFLLFVIVFHLLFVKKEGKLIWFVPLIMFAWVNLHISFVFGLFLVCIYLLKKLLERFIERAKGDITKPGLVFILTSFFLTINPNGIMGAVYPFLSLKNYGYMIVENQNIFFLMGMIDDPLITYFLIVASVLMISVVAYIYLKIQKGNKIIDFLKSIDTYIIIVSIVFAGLSIWMVRNFPLFVFSSIPALAITLKETINKTKLLRQGILKVVSATTLISTVVVMSIIITASQGVSIKTYENGRGGANFIIQNDLPGRIFNNFDIGGYLDYRLYPKYQVFVDNRPEAYPEIFFDLYRKAQRNPKIRNGVFDMYDINTIAFSHTDMTPWAQEFLVQIVQDKNWKVRYADNFMIILTKN